MRSSSFLTVDQYAAHIGVSPNAVRIRVRRGQLPHTRLGRTILIPKNALSLLPLYHSGVEA